MKISLAARLALLSLCAVAAALSGVSAFLPLSSTRVMRAANTHLASSADSDPMVRFCVIVYLCTFLCIALYLFFSSDLPYCVLLNKSPMVSRVYYIFSSFFPLILGRIGPGHGSSSGHVGTKGSHAIGRFE
jgi:undecaprenyl pyrophosphate phosphatase UppP